MGFNEHIVHGRHAAGRGLRAVADLILPRVCVVCGERLLLGEKHICLHCLADMPLTRFWERTHNPMADKFNAVIQVGLEAAWDMEDMAIDTGQKSEYYAYASALFFFSHDAPYRHIPYNIKYEGRIELGSYFGRMLGRRLAGADAFLDVDCVMPVPLHWLRRWRRGYNQAEVIAREVASALGAPLDCRTLVRRRRTRTQTRLDVKGKTANVAGAFAARAPKTARAAGGVSRAVGGATSNISKVRHILLIDDVFTTGATLHACFTALRSVFPPSVRISVATLAFVGEA